MTRIIGNILIMLNIEYILRHIVKQSARHKTLDRIRTRLRQKMYTAVAEVEPLALEPSLAMSSRKRVLMSGKKSSSGKTSLSVRESVTKPQDSKQRGLGGLLSRLAVHAARRDGHLRIKRPFKARSL